MKKRIVFFFIGLAVAISAGVLAQVYNFFPPPNSTITTHGVLVGAATNSINSVAVMAADTVLQGQGASADPAAVAVNNCGDTSHALSYSTSTHTFGCQSITGSGGGPTTVIKTAGTTRSSTTTYADDPDLIFSSQAAGNYVVECYLIITAGSGTTPGFKARFNTTDTQTNQSVMTGIWSSQNEASQLPNNNSWAAGVNNGNAPSALDTVSLQLTSGLVQSGTGTISLQWAQNSSQSTTVVVQGGSWCRLTKV